MTVAVASYNASAFLGATVASALGQSLSAIEVLVVDDGSTDDTVAVARALAAADGRVRVLETPRNLGPGGARNVALAQARGRWFAVLDADDLMTRDRLARLVAAGEGRDGGGAADVVADDLVVFDDDGKAAPSLFLGDALSGPGTWMDLATYLQNTVIYGRRPDLGFLKPMMRTDRLREADLRYDEALRIAEDDDLIVRILAAGLSYRILTSPGYLYRRHGASISHRLSATDAQAMLRASGRRMEAIGAENGRVWRALSARHRAMLAAEAFARWVEAVKACRLGKGIAIVLERPAMLPLLRMPLGSAWRRLASRRATPDHAASPAAALSGAIALAAARSGASSSGSREVE